QNTIVTIIPNSHRLEYRILTRQHCATRNQIPARQRTGGWMSGRPAMGKFFAAVLLGVIAAEPAFAFEVRPNPNLTGGSVRIDGHDVNATCGHSKAHRGPMSHARRDEILTEYGLPPGEHPDYEIDHLIPLCLGGSDDPSNLWPQPRRSIEPKWNAEAKDRLE